MPCYAMLFEAGVQKAFELLRGRRTAGKVVLDMMLDGEQRTGPMVGAQHAALNFG